MTKTDKNIQRRMNHPNWKNDDGRMLEDNYMGMKMAVARTTMNRIGLIGKIQP